jgi:hypothetical protein
MKGRKQNIFNEKTCPQKNRTASEGYVGGQTFMRITENNLTENSRVDMDYWNTFYPLPT